MPHPEQYTIGRYLRKPEYAPRLLKEEVGTVIIEFSLVHPPRTSCPYGGYRRGIKKVPITAASRKDARSLIENEHVCMMYVLLK